MFKEFTILTREAQRNFSLLPPIRTVGFLPNKKERIVRTFDTCNFSFILQGEGEYLFRGKRYEVKAPCMLIQWPDEPMSYGADAAWTEMYFIYPGETFPIWQNAGLLSPSDPVRKMFNVNRVIDRALSLYDLLHQPGWNGDRVDSLCYDLLLETWLEEQSQRLENTFIPAIRKKIEDSIGTDMDCRALAKEFNMSLSTFRRYWKRYHGDKTFMDYRNDYFLMKSCRLLAETDLAVKEIADQLHFADPFYFSRKFTLLCGMTPIMYRKKYQSM